MQITRATEVQIRRPEWLIRPYLPKDEVILLTGGRRKGKGLLCATIGAYASRGWRLPWDLAADDPLELHQIAWVMASVGEDRASEVVSRFVAAGGDPARLHLINLDRDDTLADLRKQLPSGPTLMIVDPLQAIVGDLSSPAARSRMEDLVRLARETSTTIIAIRHLTKNGRGRGRGEIADVARSQLYIGKHPAEPDLVVVVQAPSSYGEGDPLAFKLNHLSAGPVLGFVEDDWDDNVTLSDLVPRPEPPRPRVRLTARHRVRTLLLGLLGDGPATRTDVLAAARRRGMSERTVERTARDMAVVREEVRAGGRFASAVWSLPVKEPEDDGDDAEAEDAQDAEPSEPDDSGEPAPNGSRQTVATPEGLELQASPSASRRGMADGDAPSVSPEAAGGADQGGEHQGSGGDSDERHPSVERFRLLDLD